MSKLADNIKAYRKKHNLSQSQFANRLHVTKQAVSKWETGRGYPDSSLIPVIAKEMGISIDSFMGEKRINKRMIALISVISILVVIMIVLTPMIVEYFRKNQEFKEFKEGLEEVINLDLPDRGTLVYADFQDWVSFGNTFPISKMSYLVFKEADQITEFELLLESDSRWVSEVDGDLLYLIPTNVYDYMSIGDYYLVYNVVEDSYNDLITEGGTYGYMLLIYQKDNNRLIVFEYSIDIEGGF